MGESRRKYEIKVAGRAAVNGNNVAVSPEKMGYSAHRQWRQYRLSRIADLVQRLASVGTAGNRLRSRLLIVGGRP
ncbi:hypothetical protein ACLOJK_011213 [Asimina triloba]